MSATYLNPTEVAITVAYETPSGTKQHTVEPGQHFTFDESAENAGTIIEQLVAGGAIENGEEP